jgi:hypothetical protein
MTFVNPYTFISFPTKVIKEPALGHAPSRTEAEERYTGTLDVTWTLKSPLAIPNDGSWGLSDENDAEVRIPGSSVKGAVRSLHEALFAGCARIMDPLFTPVYREPMVRDMEKDWSLALVISGDAEVAPRRSGNGYESPTVEVLLCDKLTDGASVDWVRAEGIRAGIGGATLPKTGDFIEIDWGSNDDGNYRKNQWSRITSILPVPRENGWTSQCQTITDHAIGQRYLVILATDVAARSGIPYWAAAEPNRNECRTIGHDALRRFRQRLRGADRASITAPIFEPVTPDARKGLRPEPLAQRRTVDGWLRQGDVIWVRLQGNEVVDLKLSLGWRRSVDQERRALVRHIPDAVLPCDCAPGADGKPLLCLSCVLFGGIDPSAKSESDGRQHSYGGHVRFGDVVGTIGRRNRTLNLELAPLGSPHPGAGVYYLIDMPWEQLNDLDEGEVYGHWDSRNAPSRKLRGRKFYWHSDPSGQADAQHLNRPRYVRNLRVHTNDEATTTVHLVKTGTLKQRITFDGLDAVSLFTLVATLEPNRLVESGSDLALHLGRGKPLGLGSVQAVVKIAMTRTADRYSDSRAILTSLPQITDEQLQQRCGELSVIKREAAKVLSLTGLGDQAINVTYPTVVGWEDARRERFYESFKFFQDNSGTAERVPRTRPAIYNRGSWKPLPSAIDPQGQE